jgi:hypothetical protein
MEIDIPDLTQQLVLQSGDPVFSGTYSSVHKGSFHGEMVVKVPTLPSTRLIIAKQVAVKMIRPIGDSLNTMRRVSGIYIVD